MLLNYTISNTGIIRNQQNKLLGVWDEERTLLHTNQGTFECADEIEVEMFLSTENDSKEIQNILK